MLTTKASDENGRKKEKSLHLQSTIHYEKAEIQMCSWARAIKFIKHHHVVLFLTNDI